MNAAVQQAIKTIMDALGQHESNAMAGAGKVVEIEVEPAATHLAEGEESGEACPMCAAGTCDDPAHMAPEDMEKMTKGMGGGY